MVSRYGLGIHPLNPRLSTLGDIDDLDDVKIDDNDNKHFHLKYSHDKQSFEIVKANITLPPKALIDLKITADKTIMKDYNTLSRIYNSGEWYLTYDAAKESKLRLFFDTVEKQLGIKPENYSELKLNTASDLMTESIKNINIGTITIDCIKLGTNGEFDPLIDYISIKCNSKTRTTIKITLLPGLCNVEFTDDTNNNLTSKIDIRNNYVLDISTITLKRMILLNLSYSI